MTEYAFILGCEGAPPAAFPDDIKRCHKCVDGTCGVFKVAAPYLKDVLEAIAQADTTDVSIVDIANQINDDHVVTPCPNTGAIRFCTSTLVTIK